MARRLNVGDDVRLSVGSPDSGATDVISADNGHAYKDEVETTLRFLNTAFFVVSYSGGSDGQDHGVENVLKPGLHPFHCSGPGLGHILELALPPSAPSVLLTHVAVHGAPGCSELLKSGRIWIGQSAASLEGVGPTLTFETDRTTAEWSAALREPLLARVVRVSFDASHGPGENVDVGLVALVGVGADEARPSACTLAGAIPAQLGVTCLKKVKKRKNWLPLESNPKVVSKYIRKLGFDPGVSVHELLSLEDWALDMVPRPARAILLLFPISTETEESRKAGLAAQAGSPPLADIVHMRQLIGNACGTIGLVHVMANLCRFSSESAEAGSWLERFLAGYRAGLTSDDVGALLEEDAAIEAAHAEAEAGSEARHDRAANKNLHFIAFVDIRGHVVELDGRNDAPIIRGKVADIGVDFLADAVAVVRACYMEVSPDALRFNMMVVCGKATGDAAIGDSAGQPSVPLPTAISEEAIFQLEAFGFDRATATTALEATGGNVEAAANLLLG